MNNMITANELKTRGISRLNEITSRYEEAIISVHRRAKYVVVTLQQYNHLREYELEAALLETNRAMERGNFIKESAEGHIRGALNG